MTKDIKSEIIFLLQELTNYLKKNNGNASEKIELAIKDMIYSLINKVSEIMTHVSKLKHLCVSCYIRKKSRVMKFTNV